MFGDERISKYNWKCVEVTDDGCWKWVGKPRATASKPQHTKFLAVLHPAGEEGCGSWSKRKDLCSLGYECVRTEHWKPFPKRFRDEAEDEWTSAPDWYLEGMPKLEDEE